MLERSVRVTPVSRKQRREQQIASGELDLLLIQPIGYAVNFLALAGKPWRGFDPVSSSTTPQARTRPKKVLDLAQPSV